MVKKEKVPLVKSFFRSQASSLLATGADFLVTILLTELLSVWYVASNALGNLTGAAVSFLLGRFWAFRSLGARWYHQAFRYALTSLGSAGLNTGLVFLLTDYGGLQYIVSKIIAATCVGVFFNFFMYRYFVFR